MSDFMKWLYAHYIKPQLNSIPQEEYESDFSLLENGLSSVDRQSLKKTAEFIAIHAFILGLRTGRGLPL